MGKYFWPVYVAVASVSCALVWRFAPKLGARLPPAVRARICHAVDTTVAMFSERTVAQESAPPGMPEQELAPADAVAASCDPPVKNEAKRDSPVRSKGAPALDPNRPPAERGVRPVDAIHAKWGVLIGVTSVEKLDGTPLGDVSGGRFFKIKKTISTPSGLMVTGTFVHQKTKQTVRIPVDRINCLTGSSGYLSTNQQVCLRKYYELTGEAEELKAKLMREAAKKSPYLQDAADALRELRAKEKFVEKLKGADTDTLRKATYEISQLRVKFQELNQKHENWKEEHAAELPDPEKDPAYLEIINRRSRYADSIPGLAL